MYVVIILLFTEAPSLVQTIKYEVFINKSVESTDSTDFANNKTVATQLTELLRFLSSHQMWQTQMFPEVNFCFNKRRIK